ncbi:MAG: hypothetical protein WBX27_10490 [Specibacter sp.]
MAVAARIGFVAMGGPPTATAVKSGPAHGGSGLTGSATTGQGI